MARYAISREGINALRSLARNIQSAGNDILYSSSMLLSEINGLEDGLGIYYKHILQLVREVIRTVQDAKEGDDGIDVLYMQRIPKRIELIEEVCKFDSETDNDEDEPYQKKKALRR